MTASETNDPLLCAALNARCETTVVDFKSGLDVDSKGDWLEVLKDLVAMANSGGGVILFGLNDSCNPTASDLQPILEYDPSRIGDKLREYTGVHFGDFTLFSAQRGATPIAVLRVLVQMAQLEDVNENHEWPFLQQMRRRLNAASNDVSNMGTIHVPIRHSLVLGAGKHLFVHYAGKRLPLWRLFGSNPDIGCEAGWQTYLYGVTLS